MLSFNYILVSLVVYLGLLTLNSQQIESAPYLVSDDRIRSRDISPFLGRGYDNFTATLRSTCLTYDPVEAVEYTIPSFIHTFYDLAVSASAKAELTTQLTSSYGSGEVTKELSEEQTTIVKVKTKSYMSVSTMRIERDYQFISKDLTDLNPPAKTVLIEKKDYVGFFKACGPSYISGIRRAQEVVAIYKFNSFSRHVASQYNAELKVKTKPQSHPTAVDGKCKDPTHFIDKDGKCCTKSTLISTGQSQSFASDPNPYQIQSGRRSIYCITLMRGNTSADLMTWKCGTVNKKWQMWIKDPDGKIRSGVDRNKCISLGKNPKVRNKPRLEDCLENTLYQQWTSDDKGRIVNKDNNFYIGVSSGCFIGLTDGSVLEAQIKYDKSAGHICPKFNSQYWRFKGSGTTTTVVEEVVCKPHDPPKPGKVGATAAGSAKFSSMSKSLTIKIKGYGIGLNQYGSCALVVFTIDEFNEIMNFVYVESLTRDTSNYEIGMVYGITATPWPDNTSFQNAVGIAGSTVEIIIAEPVLNEPPCAEGYVQDKNNKCCKSSELYDATSLGYTLTNLAIGKTAEQSTTANSNSASLAVDGNKDVSSATETTSEADPYWSVNLGKSYEIMNIVVHKSSASDDRLAGFQVTVFRNHKAVWTKTQSGALADETIIEPPSTRQLFGDTIEVKLPGDAKTLSLAEVEVYGFESRTQLEIRNGRRSNLCLTLARGNTSANLITWHCGETKSKSWQQWYYIDGSIHSAVDKSKCIDLGATAKERNTFFLSDCNGAKHQQWNIDENGRIQNVQHGWYIGTSSGCFLGVTHGSVMEAQVKYDSSSPTDKCETGKWTQQTWSLSGTELVCRPTEEVSTTVVKETLASNAEFISRLDMAVRQRQAQISTLGSCISSTKYPPSKYEYTILKPQDAVGVTSAMKMEFTLAELKKAIDPKSDYGLLKHLGKELDEYIEMYMAPCLGALYGANDLKYVQKDQDWFMKSSWFDHPECNDFDCLKDDMRWGRKAGGGCVPGLLSGSSAEAYSTSDESTCAKDMDKSGATQECKYASAELNTFHTEATDCWSHALPAQSISYFIRHFCNPSLKEDKVSSSRETELVGKFYSKCKANTSSRRRLMLGRKRRTKANNMAKNI